MEIAEFAMQEIEDSTGDQFKIAVMKPEGEDARHGVVLLPAIAGINDYVRGRAADLTAAGYLVAVVDYFGRGEGAPDLSTPARIDAAVAAVSDLQVLEDIDGALKWMAGQGISRDRVAVLGFCIGGTYALLAAAKAGAPACAVAYYGQLRYAKTTSIKPRDPMAAAADLSTPILGHFGDMDRLISRDELADFVGRLRETQRHHEIFTYVGAPHAFDEWFRPLAYRPVASQQAWARTLIFIDWHVRGRRVAPPAQPPISPITT